jgi:hypothetical protein
MNKVKLWVARRFFKELITEDTSVEDASGQRELVTGLVKRVGLRLGDISSKDFEDPEFDLASIYSGYNTDSYIRQGVDKYIDQVFKEGYDFYGKDTNIVNYINLRLSYIAEATGIPTGQLLIDIAEDVVKYANCIIAKARAKDATTLPPSVKVTGLNGAQPIAGYFCLNATTLKVKRDANGTITGWQQEVDGADKTVKFKPEDIVHIYYKREKGNAFGTSFLIPVLDDVRALRQAEENVLRMMYRNIYPFYHMAVGEKDAPGTPSEIAEVQDAVNNMDVEGGIVTTNRVVIKPIASDQVINAEPYLRYLEDRVFSGMGVPAIMFGRGNTANRSTGDNMTSEMADRIKAIQKTIEMFINNFIIKELLMEGGYDPVLNPDQAVEFRFRENDLDTKIKAETHAIYQYEHNAITEDEMRNLLGRDPITDRAKMHQTLITQANASHSASLSKSDTSNGDGTQGTKATNNKQKPTNQHGTKTSPKKVTNSMYEGLVKDCVDELRNSLNGYISDCKVRSSPIKKGIVEQLTDRTLANAVEVINCTLDITEYDTAAIQKNTVNIYNQLKKDIHASLIDLHDYTEAIGLINTIIDLTQVNLLELI